MIAGVVAAALIVAPPERPPEGLTLRWEAPPGCPGEAEVRARVVRMTGEEAARKARLGVRGTVRAGAKGRWTLELELTGETGTGRRSLQAGRCEELAEAGALVVAIAVDPKAALGAEAGLVPPPPSEEVEGTGPEGQVPNAGPEPGAGPSAGPGPSTGTSPSPVSAEPVASGGPGPAPDEVEIAGSEHGSEGMSKETGSKGQVQTDSQRIHVGVRAAGGVSFARLLPGPSAAVNLAVSVSGRRWRAEIGGLYAPPVSGGSAQIGGVFQAGSVELRGCPVLRRKTIEVPLCLGLQLGAMQGKGRGTSLVSTATERTPWVAATAGAALGWRPRGRVGLWLQADMIVALTRPTFVTAGGETIHRAARLGGQVLAGIEVRLR